jgi:hypothetical protein
MKKIISTRQEGLDFLKKFYAENKTEGENKYSNKKGGLNGYSFDSNKEAERYKELLVLEKLNIVTDLRFKPQYKLIEAFKDEGSKDRDIIYVADFEYKENGKTVVEDVKGITNRVAELLFLSKHSDDYTF